MKKLLILTILGLVLPSVALAETPLEKPFWQHQLELEAYNLETYGNPFGASGKFEELYDLVTLKPWWQIQLEKEAWSMETYGNPFGYPMVQKILPEAPAIFQSGQTKPLTSITPVMPIVKPVEEEKPVEAITEPITAIQTKVWVEYRGYDQPLGLQPYIHYQGTWESGVGSLFCKNPNFPNGAFLFKDKKSGYIQYELVRDWKDGDTYECTWTVGDEKRTISGIYTKQ